MLSTPPTERLAYYYFIQQLCVYCVNVSDTGASDIGHIKGYLTWLDAELA